MKRVILPDPPNPDDARYKNNPLGFQRDAYQWMKVSKGKIEQASAQNDTPLDQNFVLGSFTTNTGLAGTDTGTNVTNFVCSLVQAFTNKRIIKTIEVSHD